MSIKLTKGGYIKDTLDPRDYIFSIPKVSTPTPIKPTKQPSIFTLVMPPVLDQGNLGSCVANAVCNALGYIDMKAGKSMKLKSRLFNYYNTRVIENTVSQDSGCQIRDAIKSDNQNGDCFEISWPYNISRFIIKPTSSCYTEASKNKLTVYQRVNQDRLSIKACLTLGYPIIIGFTCFNTIYNRSVEINGDIPMPTRRDYVIGGHCVLIIGYNDTTQTYTIQNSWGTGWGRKGFGTLPYNYVENINYATDFWMVTKD